LADESIGADGAKALANALNINTTLTTLDLGGMFLAALVAKSVFGGRS